MIRFFCVIAILIVLSGCKDERSQKGDLYFRQGEYEMAIREYDEYLKLKPRHVKSIYNRGRAYEELGNYDRAFQNFKKVLEIDPENVNALLSVGQYYYRLDEFDKAFYNFDLAVEKDPNSAMALYLRGKSYHMNGMIPQALEDYNNAIRINKEFGDAYISRGAIRVYLKRFKRACTDFIIAKSLDVEEADELIRKYCQ